MPSQQYSMDLYDQVSGSQQHQQQHQQQQQAMMMSYVPSQSSLAMAAYANNNPNVQRPVDNLLNMYLNQEGIDRRYSQLILKELYDATEMTNDQLNQAATELISKTSNNNSTTTSPKPSSK